MSSELPIAPPPVPEGRLGKYRLIAPLAEGGMARVYVAQRDGASELCVLKQLLEGLVENDVAATRFQREAHLSAMLVHPRIARVTDAGFEDGSFCIAMELIVGKDIESMMHSMLRARRLLPYQISVTAIAGVLEALEYAHAAKDPSGAPMNVVHRDLSPRNMMIGFDGETKVIDFGMAKGSFDDFRTRPGMVLGTLRYVSPEQAQALPIDARSDLYTVSVVLHELLTGRFMVNHGKPGDMLRDVVIGEAPPAHTLNPGLPPALSEVLKRGLAKDPKQRYQTAGELRRALLAATGEWGSTPSSLIAEFMREQFPAELAKAETWRRLADSTPLDMPISKTRTVMLDELTEVRPTEIDPSETQALKTKTGLAFPMLPGAESRTRTAVAAVDPAELAARMAREREMTRERELERKGVYKGMLLTLPVALVAIVAAVIALRRPEAPTVLVAPPPPSASPAVGVGAVPGAVAPSPSAPQSASPARAAPTPTASPAPRAREPRPSASAAPPPPSAPPRRFAELERRLKELEDATESERADAQSAFLDAALAAAKTLPADKQRGVTARIASASGSAEDARALTAQIRAAAGE